MNVGKGAGRPPSAVRAVLLGALATAIFAWLPGLGWGCSCFFGLIGALGALLALRVHLRGGAEPGLLAGAWLGLYAAVVGSVAAFGLQVVTGAFAREFTHERLLEIGAECRRLLVARGAAEEEARATVRRFWPLLEAMRTWLPLLLLAANALGGAVAGAVAAGAARARRARRRG